MFNKINEFCVADLSAIYVDVTKDRMYCDAPTSLRRRSTQTVMHETFLALVKLLAPIIAYTADEAWEHAGFEGSVHEQDFPVAKDEWAPGEVSQKVASLLELRGVIQAAIEEKVQAKEFNKNNEANVLVTVPEGFTCIEEISDREFATEFFILPDLKVEQGETFSAEASKTEYAMGPRCRRYEPLLESGLCERCDAVVAALV